MQLLRPSAKRNANAMPVTITASALIDFIDEGETCFMRRLSRKVVAETGRCARNRVTTGNKSRVYGSFDRHSGP